MEKFYRNDNTLLEITPHGTPDQPIEEMHFTVGPHGDYMDSFLADLHWHPEIEIVYIEKGAYTGIVNLDQTELHPGDVMFAGSQALHYLKSAAPECGHETLLFHPKALGFSYDDRLQQEVFGPLLSGAVTFPHFLREEDPLYNQILPLLREIMNIAKEQPDDWYISCKLELIKLIYLMQKDHFLTPAESLISRGEAQKIERFKKLSAYMDEHLSEKITLDELASIAATNSQYLCRFFKEISGMSPLQYLISHRIDRAASLLITSDQSVLEIAMDCGFENVSYFIRKFKQQKGVTPGEYRSSSGS